MKIRIIANDTQLYKLYDLYTTGTPITGKQLLDSLKTLEGYVAFGVYEGEELIAFLDGYHLTSTTFKLGNIYKGKATAREMLRLYPYFKRYLLTLGYTGWRSSSTEATKGIVQKLGAVKWEQH